MLPKPIKKLAASTFLVLWPLIGIADPLVFSSGIEGGGYWSAATRLQGVAAGMELEVQVEESPGSVHNLALLLDSADPTSLALTQADALQHYLNEHPTQSPEIEILESIGQECVFIITAGNSAIHSDKDLQQEQGYQLAISSPESGVAVTYAYMSTLVPEMARTSVLYTDTGAALSELQTPNTGSVDAVMMVHRPKEYSPEVDAALRHPNQFRFVEISDERLKGELPNGEPVYRSLKLAIPVPDSEERRQVNTICVKGLLVANKAKLLPEQRDILARIVNEQWMNVFASEH